MTHERTQRLTAEREGIERDIGPRNHKRWCYAPPHSVEMAEGVTIEVLCTRDARSHKTGHLSRVPLGDYAEMVVRWPGAGVPYEEAG